MGVHACSGVIIAEYMRSDPESIIIAANHKETRQRGDEKVGK
jgi:hypothetical protein